MAGSEPIADVSGATDTATLAQQQMRLAEDNSMSGAIADRMQSMRSESLESSRFVSQQTPDIAGEPVMVGPARVSNTTASSGPASVEASDSLQTLDTVSEIAWRMVSFSYAAGMMEKTDKSAKMFIQAQ